MSATEQTLTETQKAAILAEAKADGETHADEAQQDGGEIDPAGWGNAAVEASRYADSLAPLRGTSAYDAARKVYCDEYERAAEAACQ